MISFISEPVVTSALVAGGIALATKLWDRLASKHKERDLVRIADHELLSKDEQVFRATIIQQLQACHDSVKLMMAEKAELERQNVALTARVALLEVKLEIAQLRGGAKA